MRINKPIFIIGSGRSGTTVFYNHLAIHPELCWFSNYSNNWLKLKAVPLLHRSIEFPVLGSFMKKEILAKNKSMRSLQPSEGEYIYHKHCKFRKDEKTTVEDYNPVQADKFKQVIHSHLAFTGKGRFLSKQTANTQRLGLINYLFADAYFIHMIRDGRAVANSLHNVDWWNEIDLWWMDKPHEEWKKNPVKLCGQHWKRNVNEILDHKELLGDRYIEIRYEDFVDNVPTEMDKILDFCDLSHDGHFLDMLPDSLPNNNYKWQKNLSKDQQQSLNDTLNDMLKKLGYRTGRDFDGSKVQSIR